MYPQQFFSLFPPLPRTLGAFVAMSFDEAFDGRWDTVLKPALQSVAANNIQLEPFRVNISLIGDAILTQVLDAIANSTVIVADITAPHELNGRAVRNANVMYEVGLAHAARLPEEVVIFRSDPYPLDFDIQGVRVHSYDPDSRPDDARRKVSETVIAALQGLEARRHAAVRFAGQRLTQPAIMLLFGAMVNRTIAHPPTRNLVQAVGAIERTQGIALLLELGAIRASVLKITAEMLAQLSPEAASEPPVLNYELTPFGTALHNKVVEDMGFFDPEVRASLDAHFGQNDPAGVG